MAAPSVERVRSLAILGAVGSSNWLGAANEVPLRAILLVVETHIGQRTSTYRTPCRASFGDAGRGNLAGAAYSAEDVGWRRWQLGKRVDTEGSPRKGEFKGWSQRWLN